MNLLIQALNKQANLIKLGCFPQAKVQGQVILKSIDLTELLLEGNPSLPMAVQLGPQIMVRLIGADMDMKEVIEAVEQADSQLQSGLLAASLGLNPDIRRMIMDLHNALKPLLTELSKGATEAHGNE